MGSSLSCLCAPPEGKVGGSERCCRRPDSCSCEGRGEVASYCYKTSCNECTDAKLLDGGVSLETAVLAECSPARWTELRAAQLDWQSSHAQQDVYAQASAEAFASSRQALQTFARLSGKASQASEAAALSLIREPLVSSPPILKRPSFSSIAGECAPEEGLHAALSAPAQNLPLSQLCHELPISQIIQGSPHLHGLGESDVLARSSASLQTSTETPQQEQGRCCPPGRSQHGAEQSSSRTEGSQHGMSCPAPDAAQLTQRSSSGVQQQSQPSHSFALRTAREAGRSGGAPLTPFCQPPPRRSFSYSTLVAQGSACCPTQDTGTEARMPPPMSSPFLSDQRASSLSSPFNAWIPVPEQRAREDSGAADCAESLCAAGPSISPFFCSEPPLRSGSTPAPTGCPGLALRKVPPVPRPAPDARDCPPASSVASMVDLHKEVNIEVMMQLVCTVLQCNAAMLSLVDSTEILVVRNGRKESKEETEASLLPSIWLQLPISISCTPAVVHDVEHDNRLPAGSQEVLGRGFFCAKPLCSAVCKRLGTLCIAAEAPREFGAPQLGILNNLSELIVREIETACERAEQRLQSRKLLAAMDLYQDAFMLVDTTVHKWRILHLNLMAANEIGVQREEAKDAIFWDMFEVRNPHTGELAEPWVPCEAAAAKRQKFVLHKVRLGHSGAERMLTMRFRPACQEMQGNASTCGLPLTQPGRPFYFVEVLEVPAKSASPLHALPPRAMYTRTSQIASPRVQTPRGVCPLLDVQSGPSQSSLLTGSPASERGVPDAIPFLGLELGQVLGRGAFGRVFQGTYNGKPVAVKIIVDNDQARVKDGLPVEAHITAGLNHRNVVRTIAHAWRPLVSHMSASMSVWDSAGSSAAGPLTSCNEGETWLLLELCDKGTLQEAIISGFFKQPAPSGPPATKELPDKDLPEELVAGEAEPAARMDATLSTALEVANGMSYLHARSIVHGDLTGSNVLLQECQEAPYGFTAKVADFGLSREMQSTSRIETRTCGTITHMPPELLSDDVVSKAADVYAFGVLMWELYHGVRAWEGLNHAQVIHAVAIMNTGLEFAPGCPAPYQKLSARCMSVEAGARPTFEEVVSQLQALKAELGARQPADP